MLRITTFLTSFIAFAVFIAAPARGCPFCIAESLTLTEEMDAANSVIIARLIKESLPPDHKPDGLGGFGTADPETGKATFEIVEILKGKEQLIGIKEVQAICFEKPDPEKKHLIRGLGEPLEWTIPFSLSETAIEYVKQLSTLPKEGPERLKFFLDYLEHEDSMLAQDAHDEFARAPYEDVKAIKDLMDREQLLAWIESPDVSPGRRRLFLTMLGVCGTQDDLKRLEEIILSDIEVLEPAAETLAVTSIGSGGPLASILLPEMVRAEERRSKTGLDALVGCYVVLGGPEKMDVIDERFLKGDQSEITHTFVVLMALRILTDGMEVLPPERAAASARLLLDNRDFADQVIPDLARWEDWTVLDQLAEKFRLAQKNSYIREPIVTYFDIAAEQPGEIGDKARKAVAECERIDPDCVERARSLAAFGMLARARGADPAVPPSSATRATAEAEEEEENAADDSATAAEVVADETPASEIPDPATGSPATYNGKTEVATTDGADDSPAEQITKDDKAPGKPVKMKVSKSTVAPLPELSRSLVIGVPVLGAALFMGLFWLILRAGPG